MNNSTSPFVETRPFMPKNLSIPDYPIVLAGNEYHLSEERLCKIPFSLHDYAAHVISLSPIYLKIVPHSDTQIAFKEQMVSILSCL